MRKVSGKVKEKEGGLPLHPEISEEVWGWGGWAKPRAVGQELGRDRLSREPMSSQRLSWVCSLGFSVG